MCVQMKKKNMFKLKTSEVDKLQKEWGNKPCNHDKGYGYEYDDVVGCNCDCFCVVCGMRHTNPDFFKERMEKKS